MEVLKESQKNKFDHLPDDIVLQILNKLWEAKWICRCSIVSKRFASLVPCINNVSVKAPHYVSTWLEQEKWNNSVFDYLVGLKDIEYLHLEERFFGEADLESSWFPLLKWKTGDFNTNIKSFTFVKASSLNRAEEDDEEEGEGEEEDEDEDDVDVDIDVDDEDEDEEEDEEEDEDEEDKRRYPVNIAFACFKDACMRLNIALDMIGKHQKLRSITITDIEHQGKIVVSGDQISKLRDLEKKKLSMPKVNSGRIKLLLKYCRLPSLHLPKSKFMMALPTLFHIRWVNPSCNGGADVYDEMLAGSFDGDEAEVFNEAVEVILAKHKKEMSTECIKKRGNARFLNLGLQ